MLPFTVHLRPGSPISEQILFAVRKAIVRGDLKPGDRFPSVRTLSQELQINPNTAHRVVAVLIQQRLLAPQPGVGTVVLALEPGSQRDQREVLEKDVEKLLVKAIQLQLPLKDLLNSINDQWNRLTKENENEHH